MTRQVEGHHIIVLCPTMAGCQRFLLQRGRLTDSEHRTVTFLQSCCGSCHSAYICFPDSSELRIGVRARPAPSRCGRIACHIAGNRRRSFRPLCPLTVAAAVVPRRASTVDICSLARLALLTRWSCSGAHHPAGILKCSVSHRPARQGRRMSEHFESDDPGLKERAEY